MVKAALVSVQARQKKFQKLSVKRPTMPSVIWCVSPLRDGRTLHHDILGRYGAGRVQLRSAPAGTGIIAGGPMRAVFEALGIQDIVGKSIGTSNPHNMIKATFVALKKIQAPRSVASKRGRKVAEILGKTSEQAAAS